MPRRLDILRHGETTLSHTLRGSTDDELTPKGWQQMQQSICQIPQSWQVIITSPLQRCQQFAQQLATQLQLPCWIEPDLKEMHFGLWEGQSTQDLYAQFPEQLTQFWQSPTHFTPPEAESIQAFEQRVLSVIGCIEQKMHKNNYQHALVVSHGGVIKLLKNHALQQHLDCLLTMSAELGQLHRFHIDSSANIQWIDT